MQEKEPKIIFNGIIFNDLDDLTNFYLLTDIPEGMAPPTLSVNSSARVGAHGAVHGNSFYGRRFISLTGKIIAENQNARVQMEKKLLSAFSLPRNPRGTLSGFNDIILENEEGVTLHARAKVIAPPKIAKEVAEPWYRDFSITLEMEKFFWEGDSHSLEGKEKIPQTDFILDPTFQVIEGARTLVEYEEFGHILSNNGNYDAAPHITINGPANTPKIINDTTEEFLKISVDLLEDEKLEIDTENGSVFRVKADGSEVDESGNISDDSTWVYLQPGENNIKIEDATPEKVDFSASFIWRDTFL